MPDSPGEAWTAIVLAFGVVGAALTAWAKGSKTRLAVKEDHSKGDWMDRSDKANEKSTARIVELEGIVFEQGERLAHQGAQIHILQSAMAATDAQNKILLRLLLAARPDLKDVFGNGSDFTKLEE